jgi:pimeloyl-ACP methyl ester carboxylesterase
VRPRAAPDRRPAAPGGSFVRLTRGLVRYELSGPPDGLHLVLVGGLSVPYETWDRNAPALAAEGFRVLRYDHFGRGHSDRPRARYDLGFLVGQLAELLPALGLAGPVVLAGLSMGGAVAAAAATRLAAVRGLVLVDPYCERLPIGSARRLLLAPVIGDAAFALAGGRILAEGQRGDFLDPRAHEEFMPLYAPPLRRPGIPRAVLSSLRSMPTWPLAETYGALAASGLPTLLVWGREDATLPFEQGERLAASLPSSRFLPVDRAGHVPHWERPGLVNGAIADFLRSLPARPVYKGISL